MDCLSGAWVLDLATEDTTDMHSHHEMRVSHHRPLGIYSWDLANGIPSIRS